MQMKKLKHPDHFYLLAAQGWLELGNHIEANEELEKISPELRAYPLVLELRCVIYARAKLWPSCVEVADALVRARPKKSMAWIQRSFALHVLKRTQEAFDSLLPVADEFPGIWTIPYNLACYCAQFNRLDDSRVWFQKAMAIDEKAVQKAAIDDPDLKPLWDGMSGTMWRRE